MSLSSEDESDYRHGGYHKIEPGDLLNNDRYRAIKKLGWGHFSIVWLCWDNLTSMLVAIKVVKSATHYTEAALDEIKLLERISNESENINYLQVHVVKLFDHFLLTGPHGRHVCMVFEVLGENLLQLIRKFDNRGLPIELVKRLSVQMLKGLNLIHQKCQIIHTDLKPENVLLCLNSEQIEKLYQTCFDDNLHFIKQDRSLHVNSSPPSMTANINDIQIKIADFGNACWTFKHFTDDIQTRQYRSPEVILGSTYNTSTDIWSLACIIFELLTGDYLFSPHSGGNYSKDEDHLAQIMELLGKPTRSFVFECKRSHEFFNKRGELRHIKNLEFWNLQDVLVEKYKFEINSAKEISDFLIKMLQISPNMRYDAQKCLCHQWLAKI